MLRCANFVLQISCSTIRNSTAPTKRYDHACVCVCAREMWNSGCVDLNSGEPWNTQLCSMDANGESVCKCIPHCTKDALHSTYL